MKSLGTSDSSITKRFSLGRLTLSMTKRASGTSGQVVLSRILAIVFSAVLVAVILLFALEDKSDFGESMFRIFIKPFTQNILRAVRDAVPLLIVTLGIAVAFKMKLWNIGGNGQMITGALFSYVVWFLFPEMPRLVIIPLMILASLLGGAVCAAVSAFTRAYFNVNETITTLMMNYIVLKLADYLISVGGPLNAKTGMNESKPLPNGVILSEFGSTSITTSLLIAIIVLIVYWLIMGKSKWGYEIRAAGESGSVAEYAGMPVRRNIVLTMLISGAVAGLAGYCILAGSSEARGFSGGSINDLGFTAVMVAWISRLNPWGIALMALFIVGISDGSTTLQTFHVDKSITDFIQGLILMTILSVDFLTRYELKLTFAKKNKVGEENQNG